VLLLLFLPGPFFLIFEPLDRRTQERERERERDDAKKKIPGEKEKEGEGEGQGVNGEEIYL